jgi:hypothetical protein
MRRAVLCLTRRGGWESEPYGEAVGLGFGEVCASFSLAFAALAVACCRRSESDFSRSASGVLCGLTVVLSSEREQPAVANRLRARIRRRKFFITWKKVELAICVAGLHCYSDVAVSAISKTKAPHGTSCGA